jgi:hypothetical protein
MTLRNTLTSVAQTISKRWPLILVNLRSSWVAMIGKVYQSLI